MKKIYTFLILSICFLTNSIAQNNVGIGTNTPNPNAKLDISSTTKGILIPRMTSAQRTTLAGTLGLSDEGLMVYDTDLQKFFYWDKNIGFSGNWNQVRPGSLSNGTIWIGDASNIAVENTMSGDATLSNTGVIDLSNNAVETSEINNNAVTGAKIDISGNTNGSIMYYDGTDWVNLGPGTAGQILQTNGAAAPTWVNAISTISRNNVSTSTTGVTIGSGTNQVVGGSNMTIDVATNSATSPGLVSSGAGQNTMLWGTNAAGVPTWRAPNSMLTKFDVTSPTTGVTIGNGTSQVVGTGNMTISVATNSATSPGLVTTGAGQVTKVWGTDAAGNPSWVDVGTLLDAQNGLNVSTTAPNASATTPYVELGGGLVRNTTITQGNFNYIHDLTGTGIDRINHVNTTAATQGTYPFAISRAGSTDYTIGSDASYVYNQSWNSKPLQINNQGNNVLINPNAGNVGIGIIGPTQKLDVQGGNARINNSFIGDVGHGATWAGFANSSQANTTGYSILASNDGNYTFINKQNTGTGYIGFRMSNSDVAAINGAGNMGIGTVAPAANARLQVVGGAIMPQVGNTSSSGIYFPPNPGGGGGDEAYIRYYVEAGENTKMVIANINDADDDVAIRTGLSANDRLNINGNGTINLSRSVLFDCNDCGSTSAYDIADGAGGNWGDLVIQGRVLSTNSNLHLSPPGGSRVIINSTYRGAGGGTGTTGLDIEDGGIRMRKNYMYFQRYRYCNCFGAGSSAFALGNWDFCAVAHVGFKNNQSSTDEDDDIQCAVYPNGAGAGEQSNYDYYYTEQFNTKRAWTMYLEAFEDSNGITCAASCINFE